MCKLLIVPKVENIDALTKFLDVMTPILTDHDSDGLGYMGISKECGELYGERWLDPNDSWNSSMGSQDLKKPIAQYLNAISAREVNYNNFGRAKNKTLANAISLAVHARMATCEKSMQNVHPFYCKDSNTALIHNGVISNSASFKNRISTCDSEAILTQFLAANASMFPDQLADYLNDLEGWLACAVYSKDITGRYVLDIFKDSTTPLFLCEISELGEHPIFCTSQHYVLEACEQLGFKNPVCTPLKDNTHIRVNPYSGEVIFIKDLKLDGSKLRRAAKKIKVSREVISSDELAALNDGVEFIDYDYDRTLAVDEYYASRIKKLKS